MMTVSEPGRSEYSEEERNSLYPSISRIENGVEGSSGELARFSK